MASRVESEKPVVRQTLMPALRSWPSTDAAPSIWSTSPASTRRENAASNASFAARAVAS